MYSHCPICENKLIEKSTKVKCVNKCYTLVNTFGVAYEYIFDKEFIFDSQDASCTWDKTQKELNEEIEYWKENDRYLVKIMIGE